MKTLIEKRPRCLTILLTAVVTLSAWTTAAADASSQASLRYTKISAATQAAAPADDTIVFVRFATPSVAEKVLADRAAGIPVASRAAQRAHARAVSGEHALKRKELEALGAQIQSTMRVGANGMRIRVARSRIDAIRALPGVVSVAPVVVHTLDLSNSTPWVGAPAVWDASGDGSGITIGIIDTGIDYLHANLGGAGDPDEYAANDKTIIEAGSFPTAKVIGGYDFAGAEYNASSDDPAQNEPVPDPDPLDGNGHGSHVAGIAAGLGAGSIGPGVARGASLYALKVFGDVGGSTRLTADAIEWSLDPDGDGDMSDMLDVINMSLGSAIGSPGDPSAIAASNAADLGMIVVASAGNSGNTPFVTGSPGVGTNVISVAATRTGGDVPAIGVTGAPADGFYEAVEGVGAVRVSDAAVAGSLVVAEPLFACNQDADGLPTGLDNDIAGGIALVQRGGCTFDLKYLNAQMSGATAIVVYNDGANPTRVAPITMGGVGNLGIPVTIPGVMIASTAGAFLNDALTAGNALTGELNEAFSTATAYGDTMASFSSRGPGHGGSTFKPELSAPGVSTISALVGSGDGALALSGTSMAAPHVAGAGALMRQAFPEASPAAIKAMLMNSTVDAVPDGLIGPAHPLSRQGVGVMRVDRAVGLTSFASPAGVSFGYRNPKNTERLNRRVTVTNLSGKDRTFAITHVPQQTMAGVALRAPDTVRVRAHSSKSFKVRLEIDPEPGPSDDGAFSHREVDGWLILDDGEQTLRIGYLAAIDPASQVRGRSRNAAVQLRNSGPGGAVAHGYTLSLIGDSDSDSDSDSGDESALSHDEDDDDSDVDTAAVRAVGFRTLNVNGFDVVEMAVDLHEPWESMSRRRFDFYVDVDGDGEDDVRLQAADWSRFDGSVGVMVTAQEDLNSDVFFLDWFVGVGDYNDTSAAFLFTRTSSGGLVPDTFDYRLEVAGEDGDTDAEHGSIDLADEIGLAPAALGIAAGDTVTVDADGRGRTLWLLQNNRAGRQSQVVRVR